MPSITSWTRLEPRQRDDDIDLGLQAGVHDPLWLLGRQWQLGEFKGEDAGSPVTAQLDAEGFRLTRYLPRPLPASGRLAGQPLPPEPIPLEAIVEREPVSRVGFVTLRLAADAGQHFARMLAAAGLGHHRAAYLARYSLLLALGDGEMLHDDASRAFLALMGGRAIDGARLAQGLRASQGQSATGLPGLPASPAVPGAERERVLATAQRWLAWYEDLASEPPDAVTPWVSERMEYEFAVSAATPEGEIVLSAPEYVEGRLDWYSFALRTGASLGSGAAEARRDAISQTTIPVPVSYPGMPADRWWQFEDARVDFGAVDSEPDDLLRMLMVEFALIYGNDWFIIPMDLAVGSLCRITSLAVTNSFGDRSVIPPFTPPSAPAGSWQMFTLATDRRHPIVGPVPRGLLFLPPVLGPSLNSPPVEELWLLRDELANMAWAIERVVESRAGQRLDRRAADYAERDRAEQARAQPAEPAVGRLRYRLATTVPDYWIPLVPVPEPGGRGVRLQRGAVARADGGPPARPLGRILASDSPLFLRDEEVPRAGALVTRAYQYARWIDGATLLWVGRRKEPGRGEGSSGLQYDQVAQE